MEPSQSKQPKTVDASETQCQCTKSSKTVLFGHLDQFNQNQLRLKRFMAAQHD